MYWNILFCRNIVYSKIYLRYFEVMSLDFNVYQFKRINAIWILNFPKIIYTNVAPGYSTKRGAIVVLRNHEYYTDPLT